MECPFVLPVYKTQCAGGFDIRDANHKLLLCNLSEKAADYIVPAINDYEILKADVEDWKRKYQDLRSDIDPAL